MKEEYYFIYSLEHKGWWAENRDGYVKTRAEAGAYSTKEAFDIVYNANIWDADKPQELLFPIVISNKINDAVKKEKGA